MTVGLWAFCFATYYGVSFLWTDWAPPAWLLLFNGVVTLFGIAVSFALAAAVLRLDPRRGWTRIAACAVLVVVASVLTAMFDLQVWRELADIFTAQVLPRPASVGALVADYVAAVKTPFGAFRLLTYVWLFGLYSASVALLMELAAGRRRQEQLLEAQAMVQAAQLTALRYQMDPHFLFNCLNGVSSLIVSGRPAEAEDMMLKLSEMLRTTLSGDPHAATTLGEELETLVNYLAIEEIRFGGLDVRIDCPTTLLSAEVPGFILQPLAENAVKHGIHPEEDGQVLTIGAEQKGELLILSVHNTLKPQAREAPAPAGFGVGLENVRRRLEALYGAAGRLETELDLTGYVARVSLPVKAAA
jgi:signal transduction histidine kinase